MKHFFTKFASVLCSVLTAFTLLSGSALAAADDKANKDLLPSGEPYKKLEAIMKSSFLNEDYYPSFSAVVFEGNEIRFQATGGAIDIAGGIKPDADTVYEWGSVTKTLVWVSVMQLWEQGRIDLDADIQTYLPAGFFKHLKYDDKITMLHLMNHSGGWGETTLAMAAQNPAKIRSLEQTLRDTEPAQIYRPGTCASYSNWGAALAGYIVECIAGESFCDYVHHHIFEPLGMEHTALQPDWRDNPWVAEQRRKIKGYKPNWIKAKCIGDAIVHIELYPAGAACGTVSDLTAYAMALADDSAPLFENPDTQKTMFSGTRFLGDTDTPTICHGFLVYESAVRTVGHGGNTMGFTADMEIHPETHTGVVIMSNQYGSTSDDNWIVDLVFGCAAPPDAEKIPDNGSIPISEYILNLRSQFHGMMKIASLLNGESTGDYGTFHDIGNGCVYADKAKSVYASTIDENGRRTLQYGPFSDIEDKYYVPKILLFAAYIFAALFSVFLLLGRHKLKKAGMAEHYTGAAAITLGRAAKIASPLLLAAAPSVMMLYDGIPKPLAFTVGIAQMICIVCCLAAAGAGIIQLFKGKNAKHQVLRAAFSVAGNLAAIGAILYFEMYRFWGC